MKIIVITLPEIIENEAKLIVELLNEGADLVHIRKPESNWNEVSNLISEIPKKHHPQLSLHYYVELLVQFPSLNYHHSGASVFNQTIKTKQSKSFHSLEELNQVNVYNYGFISPVFDSISKQGYQSRFDLNELGTFLSENKITNSIALGGISKENIQQVVKQPFAGIALMGALWRSQNPPNYIQEIKKMLS